MNMAKSGPKLFSVLGEPTRLTIIKSCMSEYLSAGQLQKLVKVEKSLLSKHLKILIDSNILVFEKSGRKRFYTISKKICHKPHKNTLDLHCCKIELK